MDDCPNLIHDLVGEDVRFNLKGGGLNRYESHNHLAPRVGIGIGMEARGRGARVDIARGASFS
jgi:hypothetical protein